MRKLRFNVANFIAAYTKAAGECRDVESLAEELGITRQAVFNRKHTLKQRGVSLPALSRRSQRKVAARKARITTTAVPSEPVTTEVPSVCFPFVIYVSEVPHGVA